MVFTTGTITRCSGGSHYQLPVTVGQRTVTMHFTPEELAGDPATDPEQVREAVLQRIRSAIIEADARTLAQRRAALENKTFGI